MSIWKLCHAAYRIQLKALSTPNIVTLPPTIHETIQQQIRQQRHREDDKTQQSVIQIEVG